MAFAVTVGPTQGTPEAPSSDAVVVLTGCTAGNSIVIEVIWYHATVTISNITISGESNATVHGSPTKNASGSNMTHQFASLAEVTSSGDKTITVTFSGSADAGHIWAMEVSGGDTSDFFEASNGSTGNSTNGSTTIDTAASGSLIVGGWSGNNGDATAGSLYTQVVVPNISWWDEAEYDLNAGSAGTKTVDFIHDSGQWVATAAAFNVLPDPPIVDGPKLTQVFAPLRW